MPVLPHNAVLIVVDVQQAFHDACWGRRNNPLAEERIAALLDGWRASARPLIHIHHRSRHPDGLFRPESGYGVMPQAAPLPGETVLVKEVNSAFIGTGLEQRLQALGSRTVVICGITTDHCVSTTARMAGNLDFTAYVVSDATATFERTGPDGRHFSADDMHATALASLHGEFSQVVDSASLLAAL